ncbi:MAG: PLP-dependent aminotransferase family protein [Mogibacterium sp.]|uniref:aminotransferase-like domain-containing protein n=1 Tax=Mogibacterium sp. TaxID=2049035 RepID=UPI001A62EAAB|nr:PLP-dependent aminotransferase family protein [Mogibacterium sp.]MBL6468576.1 PLP-dependent aminotransferase family protein [Mogibacterium sp.]
MPHNSFENYPMSWRPILKKGTEPLYISLATQLENDIAGGVLRPGTKLPPQRELADFLDINVSTVSRAFKICSQKGLLSSTIGSGTYVAYDICTNVFDASTFNKPHFIELGSMMPETIPQGEVISLFQKMMTEPDFGKLFQYSHGISDWQREAAVKLMNRVGCPASAKRVLTASGGQNAIAAIFAGLFKPGDRLGVDPLVYPGLKSAAKLFGIQLVAIQQENGEMSEAGLRYAIKNDNIRGIYVMPDCQNPTTHTMTAGSRKMIARIAKKFHLIVIEDGINSLLLEQKRRTIYADAPEQTIFLLSLSKTVNPALRLAYLGIPEQYYQKMNNALYNINLSQSALLIELASRMIVSGELETLLERRRKGLILRNQLTDRVLSRYEIWGNSTSLNRWLCLPKGITGTQFEHLVSEHGVLVYGSERFAVGRNTPAGAVRLAICAPDSMKELEHGLTIIDELLNSL